MGEEFFFLLWKQFGKKSKCFSNHKKGGKKITKLFFFSFFPLSCHAMRQKQKRKKIAIKMSGVKYSWLILCSSSGIFVCVYVYLCYLECARICHSLVFLLSSLSFKCIADINKNENNYSMITCGTWQKFVILLTIADYSLLKQSYCVHIYIYLDGNYYHY